jgi:hypothetical protein
MSNHTIAVPITTCAELRRTDRGVRTRNEVATPIGADRFTYAS